MRLLYLIDGLGPGGAERSLAGLLPLYVAAGIETHVVCLRRETSDAESTIRAAGCRVTHLEATSTQGRIRALRRLLVSDRYDLLHTTLFDADIHGRLAAIRTGVPVLTSLVNTSYDPIRLADPKVSRMGFSVTRFLDGWTARNLTSWFHAITEAVKQSAVQSLGIEADRVSVVSRGRSREQLGVPGEERRSEIRRRLGIPAEARLIVNVARQEYQKGQAFLLEAVRTLLDDEVAVTLLICGREGHASPELRQMHADLGLGSRVRFLGDRDDVPDILAGADLFAFPSLYEGLGGSVIEAMALGLPIVCSDIPALREVVEEGGNALLAPARDSRTLARAIGRVLDDTELSLRMGRRSQEIFDDRFTLARSAEGMIELYRTLAERTHARHPVSAGATMSDLQRVPER